ncbi:MAG: helix-turn-helix domain-containing protein [Clostridia bacterium]|nr:helix-turn-helix domain-containing protein [Clostridia bacterium]MDY3785141.1 helix-turn-helix domain-containing protein [Eubacteriales bacterium]
MESPEREVLIERMTDNLPVLRKKLRLSQEELAELIGSSRYTIVSIETRKRKMTWNTFLSLILLFDKNDETAILLRALDIYTKELDSMIIQKPCMTH